MYDKFERLLSKNKVTPYRVHKETGISTATLSDWKNGKSQPKKDKIERICEYFKVPISYFYGEDDSVTDIPQLTERDKRDISKDLNHIMSEIRSGGDGPLYYNGIEIDEKSLILLENAIEHALTETKKENKVKYNPYKNKK